MAECTCGIAKHKKKKNGYVMRRTFKVGCPVHDKSIPHSENN